MLRVSRLPINTKTATTVLDEKSALWGPRPLPLARAFPHRVARSLQSLHILLAPRVIQCPCYHGCPEDLTILIGNEEHVPAMTMAAWRLSRDEPEMVERQSTEIQSVLRVLAALEGLPGAGTVSVLCCHCALSRSTVDRALFVLRGRGLVRLGVRGFGMPTPIHLTERGTLAARCSATILSLLLQPANERNPRVKPVRPADPESQGVGAGLGGKSSSTGSLARMNAPRLTGRSGLQPSVGKAFKYRCPALGERAPSGFWLGGRRRDGYAWGASPSNRC